MVNKHILRKIAGKVDASHVDPDKMSLAEMSNYMRQAIRAGRDLSKDPVAEQYRQFANSLSGDDLKAFNEAESSGFSETSNSYTPNRSTWEHEFLRSYSKKPRIDLNALRRAYSRGRRDATPDPYAATTGPGGKGSARAAARARAGEAAIRREKRRNSFNSRHWLPFDWLDASNQSRVLSGQGVKATGNPVTWGPALSNWWRDVSKGIGMRIDEVRGKSQDGDMY